MRGRLGARGCIARWLTATVLTLGLTLTGLGGWLTPAAGAASRTAQTTTTPWPAHGENGSLPAYSAAQIQEYLTAKGIHAPTSFPTTAQSVHALDAPTVIPVNSCPASQGAMQDLLDQAVAESPSAIQFNVANCSLPLTSTLTIGSDSTDTNLDITIDGNGLTFDGGGTAEDPGSFDILDLDGQLSSQLTLSNLTIENGDDGVFDENNNYNVALSNCTLRGNREDGIAASIVSASGSTFANNGSTGVFAYDADIDSSVVIDNEGMKSLPIPVGGVVAFNSAIVSNSYLDGNYVGITAGIIPTGDEQIAAVVTNSTISNGAGGIYTFGAIRVTNSTIVINGFANIDIASGSGVMSTITASTLVDAGQNILVNGPETPITLTADILADSGMDCDAPPPTDGGYNLADDNSCGFSNPDTHSLNDITDLVDGLIPPADNGGPTIGASGSRQTLPSGAIEPGSLPVDYVPANSPTGCIDASGNLIQVPIATIDLDTTNLDINYETLTTDERGVVRPQGPRCDVGSFELTNSLETLPGSTETIRQGYFAIIRVEVVTPEGQNISKRSLPLSSVELDGPDGQTIAFSHPFQFGRFGGTKGYQLSINTRNLAKGDWTLVIQFGSGTNARTGLVSFVVE